MTHRHGSRWYLLEKGADPNIPDKAGRTALMHACAGRAGEDVALLLLENGADPSLRDYSGASALVHTINTGDRQTLQALLDACKAKGKEVIIITSHTSPSGTKKTKQYLNSPPSPLDKNSPLDKPSPSDKLSPLDKPSPLDKNFPLDKPSLAIEGLFVAASEGFDKPSLACMSPSDVEIGTESPAAGDERKDGEGIFSFALTSALPLPSARPPGEKRPAAPPRKLLKRLNSEPWGLVAPSVLGAAPREEGIGAALSQTITEINGLSIAEPSPGRPLLSRRHSIETHDPCSPKLMDRSVSEDYAAALAGASWADKVQQHQILYRRNTAPESQENAAARLAHPKLTRMEHYESDTHLCPDSIPGSPDSGRVSVERRRYNASPLCLLPGSSRESLENIPASVSPLAMRRRPPGLLERRGSGTLLLDHISHTRPGFLPPLNINPQRPIPDIRASPSHAATATGKILVPVAPASPKRGPDFKTKKKLMRRHSMQTEQMKQLSTFQEILAEKVSEAND
ncbi:ankyrin repeat domain-containing protein 34A isoform X2 [Perca fluviatilis]|uniref:ankyrin repeat domain-containing protein 34A isoform X2 n=1 Tax=Perca fluviatilis TaxID=8168 RepID=UPI001964B147|nr:ankyrin repeat domain-containing protein 34A isoform X2 [Perca fluviatilis]